MAKNSDGTIIKKYANRRLYNTGTSQYVTLENLATMIKKNEEFTVQDAKTGDDITHAVLTQIIFEQESKTGQALMPTAFLRQLIGFYGDQMQMVVPSYLEQSMSALAREQVRFRETMTSAVGKTPMEMMEAQVRTNTEMFRKAMAMFNPFVPGVADSQSPDEAAPSDDSKKELDAMRDQLASMQAKIDRLTEKD
ncbi:polyhydroxyalkanoate synthesis repressor PhaR [Fulvimarina sp. 2208YS6-2-32]|uniref:Polyhydroxyalkanoate synthesis repressor PhaR n=1 Tax=Fulvimarina uroteuthidis TaxID=3098149 RepID=A0ABU5I7D2_9HYPH|nr:polyhydroxyalkanoate synthesis repressor PhaR [Fulvimarina sp. 2208YS6-2-32]MDY8110723.1 polyhydroxyalkanoate synthesis repressor PhaR [Fulvimarina sp. 2208YS6-2-32]